jgi:LuxR family maltose regulon positive regulatory protein
MGDARGNDCRQDEDVIQPPIPLMWAKLRPPVLATNTVARERVVDELSSASAALTAIVAPAGYGKTTAAAQVAERVGDPVAWVALEPADSDPARFWTYVAAALSAAGVVGADGTYASLAGGPSGLDEATLVLRTAVERHAQPITLVLDDMHLLDGDAIVQGLGDWLRHPAPNLRLICTSRRDLALPVGRLRSQGQLAEARVEDLAFDRAEADSLMRETFGISSLTADQVDALERRTEGWAVGLQLAGLGLRDAPNPSEHLDRFTGDTRHLTEYLASEAMEGLDDHVRAFLLSTSIVRVLNADLCDHLTGEVGSLRILRQLVAANVFTSTLDEAATMFSYHPLFREHLQSALHADHPEHINELHARAASWFSEHGVLDDAITHTCLSGDLAAAEAMVVDHSMQYSNAGHFDTIVSWVGRLESLPKLRVETPLLMAWILLNLRRHEAIELWLDRAGSSADSDAHRAVVAVQAPTIRAHRARHLGDVGEMIRHSNQAVENSRPVPDREATNIFLRMEAGHGAAMSVWGCSLYWSGDLEASRASITDAVSIAISTGMTLEIVFCYLYLAMIAAESGEPDDALAHADHALGLIPPGGERHHQPTLAHLARAIALSDTGRPADAAEALGRARAIAAMRPEPLQDVLVELQQSRLWHRAGDQESARASLRDARSSLRDFPMPDWTAG